jgi:periplasmic protein CpxP/Spy
MRNRYRRIALGVAAGLVALASGLAIASAQSGPEPGGPPPMMGRGPGMGRMGPMEMMGPGGPLGGLVEQLGLSDDQKTQVKGILQSHRDEWKALADRAFAAHQALQAAINADTIDEAAIRDKAAAVGTVEADIAVAHAHARGEIFRLLTPEQQAKAKELQTGMQRRMQGMRQHMGQRRGGKSGQPGN